MTIPIHLLELARRLKEPYAPFEEYMLCWASFNVCYNAESGSSEYQRMKKLIFNNVSKKEALQILEASSYAISVLRLLPPGDMRIGDTNINFRQRSTENIDIVQNARFSPLKRLVNLVYVLYQIRCNLFHGGKDPINARDTELTKVSKQVLDEILDVLLKKIE